MPCVECFVETSVHRAIADSRLDPRVCNMRPMRLEQIDNEFPVFVVVRKMVIPHCMRATRGPFRSIHSLGTLIGFSLDPTNASRPIDCHPNIN